MLERNQTIVRLLLLLAVALSLALALTVAADTPKPVSTHALMEVYREDH